MNASSLAWQNYITGGAVPSSAETVAPSVVSVQPWSRVEKLLFAIVVLLAFDILIDLSK